ncbi:MAG: glycoside hydrolase family protein [Caulobacteraceae bacterium]
MTSPYLIGDLKRDEGFRAQAYPDPLLGWKRPTIGYGHAGRDVHPGLIWTENLAADALADDVAQVCKGLDTGLPWWRGLDPIRQDCLVNQAYELGVAGLMEFDTYLGLVRTGKFEAAAEDLLADTLWGGEVAARAHRVAQEMRSGMHAA